MAQHIVELSGKLDRAFHDRNAAETSRENAMKRTEELRGEANKAQIRAQVLLTEKTDLEGTLEKLRTEFEAERKLRMKFAWEVEELKKAKAALEADMEEEKNIAYNEGADASTQQAEEEMAQLIEQAREATFLKAWTLALKTAGVEKTSDLFNRGLNAFETFKNVPADLNETPADVPPSSTLAEVLTTSPPASDPAAATPLISETAAADSPGPSLPEPLVVSSQPAEEEDLVVTGVTEGPKAAPELMPVKIEKGSATFGADFKFPPI